MTDDILPHGRAPMDGSEAIRIARLAIYEHGRIALDPRLKMMVPINDSDQLSVADARAYNWLAARHPHPGAPL